MTDVQTRTGTETDPQLPAEQHPAGELGRAALPGSRRAVLLGAGGLGAACLLAACGTDSTSTGGNTSGSDFTDNPAPAGSAKAGGDTSGGDTSGGGTTATALAAVADIPSGGGIIKGDYVITQPQAGTFKAFSKICTHAGCPVNKVDGGVIKCPCHASTFSIEDGSPTGGPAQKALAETKVKVDGDNIVKA